MFAMERPEFPVDTHVWHITKKLGWVPPTCSRESCYEHLNNRVPDSLKFALHVLLVDHGKVCKACTKSGGSKSLKKGEVSLFFRSLQIKFKIRILVFRNCYTLFNVAITSSYFLLLHHSANPSDRQAGEVPCPLRRNGEHISFSPDVSDTKMHLYDGATNSSSCMEKIKREYHVKDEDTKDERIKAEPGHHDKISMGLFPSDVKKESDQIHIKTEISLKCEGTKIAASALVKKENASAGSSSSVSRQKSESAECNPVASSVAVDAETCETAGQRRGRSAKRSAQSDAPEDEILFVKRRGAILQ